jgi:hypothetical protein
MKTRAYLWIVAVAVGVGSMAAQSQPKNFSIDPWHINVPKPVTNPVTSVTERIPGSNLSAEIIFVEMVDGVYSPIAMMKPPGNGRFPLVLLAHMNGGQATQWLREWLHYGNWTPEQLVKAGYAVAWMRYRAEINNVYGPALREATLQPRPVRVRRRDIDREVREDAPIYQPRSGRLPGVESRRRDALQDCIRVPRLALRRRG